MKFKNVSQTGVNSKKNVLNLENHLKIYFLFTATAGTTDPCDTSSQDCAQVAPAAPSCCRRCDRSSPVPSSVQ